MFYNIEYKLIFKTNMKIQITAGIGSGPTELAAFDDALVKTGVANYNLIQLSSMIPPKAELEEIDKAAPPGEWGDRLYVVVAQERTSIPNEEAWAGIGWVQQKKTSKGMFVEHHGASQAQVKRDINDTMKALVESRNEEFGPIQMRLAGTKCSHKPVCALAVAVYEPDGWRSG
jgi:arginine decarboxylase